MFWLGIGIGAASASLGWWLYVRSIGGVVSDVKDVVQDAQNIKKKVGG